MGSDDSLEDLRKKRLRNRDRGGGGEAKFFGADDVLELGLENDLGADDKQELRLENTVRADDVQEQRLENAFGADDVQELRLENAVGTDDVQELRLENVFGDLQELRNGLVADDVQELPTTTTPLAQQSPKPPKPTTFMGNEEKSDADEMEEKRKRLEDSVGAELKNEPVLQAEVDADKAKKEDAWAEYMKEIKAKQAQKKPKSLETEVPKIGEAKKDNEAIKRANEAMRKQKEKEAAEMFDAESLLAAEESIRQLKKPVKLVEKLPALMSKKERREFFKNMPEEERALWKDQYQEAWSEEELKSRDALLEKEQAWMQEEKERKERMAIEKEEREKERLRREVGILPPTDVEELPDALDLPDDAVIAIAGTASPLGKLIMQALPNAGKKWTVRELSLTAPGESFQGLDAVIVITEASGGMAISEVPEFLEKLDDDVMPRRLLMTSLRGVDDTSMFSFANLFGQRDKYRDAEEEFRLYATRLQGKDAMIKAAKKREGSEDEVGIKPGFTVIRLGKLIDDSDKVELSDVARPPRSREQLVIGDASEGDVLVSTAASVLIQALKQPTDGTLSLGQTKAKRGVVSDDQAYWDDQFLQLVGPEIYRKDLKNLQDDAVSQLRTWARKFSGGRGLTSPAVLEDVENGVKVQFKRRKGKKNDGALLFLAEEQPSPRVRVVRTGMKEEDDIVIKPMSEEVLLSSLDEIINSKLS